MNSDELKCIIKDDLNVVNHYTGDIYSYDNLPNQLIEGKFYIANDKSSKSDFSIPGHWISILFYPGYLVYVDSFGLPIEPQFYEPLLTKCNVPIMYMNKQLQNVKTSACGMHSILFSTCFSYGWNVLEILEKCYQINTKSTDPYFYDHKAQTFLHDFYNENRSIFYEF